MSGKPTVFIVDPDLPTRLAVADLAIRLGYLSLPLAGPVELFDALRSGGEGCAVLELVLPGFSAVEVVRRIKTTSGLPIIAGSRWATVEIAVEAMQQGAMTVLEKPYARDQLAVWLRKAMALAPQVQSEARRKRDLKLRVDNLHPRERLALEMLVEGEPNKTIARRLGVGRRTVDRIRASVLEKLGTDSTIKLARLLGEAAVLPDALPADSV